MNPSTRRAALALATIGAAGHATAACASSARRAEPAPTATRAAPSPSVQPAAGSSASPTVVQQAHTGPISFPPDAMRFPALALTIASPARGAAPEVDFRREFGAAGDGEQDDMPAFTRLAEAVNTGRVPAGAVVSIPAGTYRVVGNVFRYNRVQGTQNTETHGEYCVENLYLRNDARGSRMEVGGGGETTHAHDGPFNELRENYARVIRVLKRDDRFNRLIGNWHVEAHVLNGAETHQENNQRVPAGRAEFPYAAYCGHDHAQTAETARPG